MSDDITVEAEARVVEQVVKNELDPVKQTLADHRPYFAAIPTAWSNSSRRRRLRKMKTLIASDRLKRTEDFCQAAAKQLNIKFDL